MKMRMSTGEDSCRRKEKHGRKQKEEEEEVWEMERLDC
jgi:hypothetical protein